MQIVCALETDGWDLAEPRLKRAAARVAAVDPDAEPFLRRDSLFIAREEPAELATDAGRLLPACVEAWSALAPLHRGSWRTCSDALASRWRARGVSRTSAILEARARQDSAGNVDTASRGRDVDTSGVLAAGRATTSSRA